MFITNENNVSYCVFVRIETEGDTKVYTPFFPCMDEAEEYANSMRVLLPKENVIVTEPYPVVKTIESLEKEFHKVIKK